MQIKKLKILKIKNMVEKAQKKNPKIIKKNLLLQQIQQKKMIKNIKINQQLLKKEKNLLRIKKNQLQLKKMKIILMKIKMLKKKMW